MGLTFTVSATARIAAPPRRVYELIADYRHGHPSILPKEFSDLTVEQGGVGEGTVIGFDVTVLGRKMHYRATVSEPEPGRVLVEKNFEPAPSVTTFTVEPDGAATKTRITITTEQTTEHGGVFAYFERFIATRVMLRMYADELALLAARAAEPQG